MVSDILLEIVTAIGRFLINPLMYIAILFAILLGYRRVKQERKFFNRRIIWGWTELMGQWKYGWLSALLISLVSVGLGLTVPKAFIMILIAISALALLLYFVNALSPIYTMGIATLAIWLMYYFNWTFSWWNISLEGVNLVEGSIVTITILAGLCVIAEGMLIRRTAMMVTTPQVEKTKRGMQAIVYRSRNVWVLPIFFVIPGDVIPVDFPYWPQFTLGESTFALVLFPFVIGFSKLTRKELPALQLPKIGRSVLMLGQLILIGGLAAALEPFIGFITLAIGVVIRIIISIYYAQQDKTDIYAVAPSSKGAIIAAVLPDSPAEKMGLQAGECIRKVNGEAIFTENDLYEALQLNAAHCRLEVVDRNNEIRLTQHVIYSNDHYRIGLLLAEPRDI
ncbi:cell division protein MinJ [Lysinibacillus sphaericus]|uniref:PDZ domain-containing protein n=1 Tax=Lysinibacillus sphaericus TaxID=1421 RepID=UPI0018CE6BF8|nr:PDZ domain-containing protein [Lysinibacillus sphaericus]MBG9454854.1 cell division protein MinJ [Lysinibacillus sphaericus]MBG9478282.1 cell division protein MinJ [Lysinibacillus sphaericus]MBG9590995.1 cell division protein MinJ [Lysinibacillus sphaericus]